MESPILKDSLSRLALMQKIVWAVLTVAIFVYLPIALFVPVDLGEMAETESAIMMSMAAGTALLSVLLHRFFFSNARLESIMSKKPKQNALVPAWEIGVDKSQRQKDIQSLPEFEQQLLHVANSSFTPNIICWALNDSIAIHGLILTLIHGIDSGMIGVVIAAALLNVMMFPRVFELVERAKGLRRL